MRIMNIQFNEFEVELQQMQEAFNDIGVDALYMSHHELAAATEFNAMSWREFLMDPRVREFLESELALMQQASIMKMMKDIDQSKSTGQAQLLNTLIQQTSQNKKKDGPIFIYSYVPLNEEETYAPNVQTLQSDPFKVDVSNNQ
jgi:uncharacterized protein YqcC (DUF446 family)